MPSDELRRRLEALNGGPLEFAMPDTSEPATGSEVSDESESSGEPEFYADLDVRLEALLPGDARFSPTGGPYYHVQRSLHGHPRWETDVLPSVFDALANPDILAVSRTQTPVPPERTVFLDLETLGLTGDYPLFLVGTLQFGPGGSCACRQFIAREPDEEGDVLAAFSEHLRDVGLLVTFNGISFDVPLVRARARAHRVEIDEWPPHVDVLLEARRRYKRALPNCRLQTLESRLCGRTRDGDIPGSQIPGVYREFVVTGDARGIAAIAHHNVLDLATTAELFGRFWGRFRP